MANNKPTQKNNVPEDSKKKFEPTYIKYEDMTEREKGIFLQGAKMVENRVSERMGITKPKDNK